MHSPKIIRSKRKTIALVVQPNGELLVRAPQRATRRQINAMLEKHAAWTAKKQAEAEKQAADSDPLPVLLKHPTLIKRPVITDGETILEDRAGESGRSV